MKYNFKVSQELVEGVPYWIARCLDIDTIIGQGNTPDEAIAELEENEAAWLEFAPEMGIEIPEPKIISPRKKYSGHFALRISPIMHEVASNRAKEQGISLNQYVSDALSYYNGMLDASERKTAFVQDSKTASQTFEYENSKKILKVDFVRPVRKEM